MNCLVFAVILGLLWSSQARIGPTNPFTLEISTKPWLYQLSQKYSRDIKLRDIPTSELIDIKNQGYDYVWMMGIWSQGQYGLNHDRTDPNLLSSYAQNLPGYTKDDIIGSPYAITEYVTDPIVGSDYDVHVFRKRLHKLGLLLVLDFVPNHSAVDSPRSTSNPDWYVNAPSGDHDKNQYKQWGDRWIAFGTDINSGAWTDTLQFNWWNMDFFHNYAVKNLEKIASMADAIRVDMAMLIINQVFDKSWGNIIKPQGYKQPDFEPWEVILKKVKAVNPGITMIAEAYVYNITPVKEDLMLRQLGFDFTYEKQVLDRLEQQHPDWLKWWMDYRNEKLHGGVHFVENHDEPRAASSLGGINQALSGAQIAFTLPGMRMGFFGERHGYKNKLDDHLRRSTPEGPYPQFEQKYDRLMKVVAGDHFMKNGTWALLDIPNEPKNEFNVNEIEEELSTNGAKWSPERLLAWRWANDGRKRMVVANFNDYRAGGRVKVDISGVGEVVVKELLTGQVWKRDAQTMREGFYMEIPPWDCQIVEYH